jgi:DNA-binding XRE family transcriptional regulator
MPKHHTEPTTFHVACPAGVDAEDVKSCLERMGCRISDSIPASEVFPDRSPGTLLSGARYREGMTQAQLAAATGINRRHISEMENGKRPIGRANARKLGRALSVDYRLLM